MECRRRRLRCNADPPHPTEPLPTAVTRSPMSVTHTDPAPVQRDTSGIISRKDMAVIWVLLAAAFVAILNETTMGMAIPHLITDLGISPIAAQWVTSAFMLTMAVVIPITGFLLRRF